MEKHKEAVKKPCSDIYTNKKIGISKTDFLKNSTHLPFRSDTGRSKVSYISKSKNVPIPVDKKYFYKNEAKSFLKHSCEKCDAKGGHNLVVNASRYNAPVDAPKIESGRDLNGNVSFNSHHAVCSFSTSVSEISTFNKVLSYQTNRHYEISISKSSKHRERAVFPEQRTFSSKVSNSSSPVTTSKFFTSMPNSAIRCYCPKNVAQKFTGSEPYLKAPERPSQENINVTEKSNVKYTALLDTSLSKDNVKLSHFPDIVHSNLSDVPSLAYMVDYSESPSQVKKQNSPKNWDQAPLLSELVEGSNDIDERDKMLFPALPSNNHSQQVKLKSNSMPPSETQCVEKSNVESILSSSDGNTSLNAASISVTVSSAIPQASYADVIRMSSTCSGVQGYVALELGKTVNSEQNPLIHNPANHLAVEKLPKDENHQSGSSDWVISRLSQLDLNSSDSVNSITLSHCNQNGQNFVTPRPIVVSLEKPSFYNSSLQTCKNVLSVISSHTNLPLSDKKTVENVSLAVDSLSSSKKKSVDTSLLPDSVHKSSASSDFSPNAADVHIASIKNDFVFSSPSSASSFGDAFKPIENKDLNMDVLLKKDPPVIIMNNCSPPESISEISFGIEYDEMLELCSDNCSIIEDSISLPLQDSNGRSFSEKVNTNNSYPKSLKQLVSDDVATSLKSEIKMFDNESISVKGKKLYWGDSKLDFDRNNHAELADYFASMWDKLEKDCEKGSRQRNGNVHYYHEF